jgi:3-deoxy-D-manno-octulosonic-acid transferase
MFILYNILLILLWPAAAIYMLWRRFGLKKSAESWGGQWGNVPQEVPDALKSTFPRFWIHAVSVGEVMAARPVARALKSTFPNCGIVVSSTTDTGQNAARQGMERGEFDATFYYPLDFAWTVQRVFKTVQPDAILLLETELWPNFLHLAKRRGIKVFQINGRVSDNLLRQATRWPGAWRWMTGNITAMFVRSDFDAHRLTQLGVPPSKVLLTGDVKLDGIDANADATQERQRIRKLLGIEETSLFWIGGSTHEGEEVLLLDAQRELQSKFQVPLRLLIAPRHPERVETVLQLARDKGFTAIRRSRLSDALPEKNAVIILDTVGELAEFYAAADLAFVGGSLIKRGGHNVLEPVLVGVPVLFGPYMNNFRAAADLVQDANVGQLVHSEIELTAASQSWLMDPSKRARVIQNAKELLFKHQGAARRVAEGIKNYESDFE